MRRKIFSAVVACFLVCGIAVAEGGRQDLGINGCSVQGLAHVQSLGLTLVACDGPNGIYYSHNFGDTWTRSSGGDYTSGRANGVAATSFGVYALVSDTELIRSDAGTPGVFPSNWASVGLDVILSTFCISSREGRLSSDVPQKLCMGKFDKHLPRELVSQFSSELVLFTFP